MKRVIILFCFTILFVNLYSQTLPEKSEIINSMKLVNSYWIAQHSDPGDNKWARAAYFTGSIDFYKTYPKQEYLDYITGWAEKHNWGLNYRSNDPWHADDQCAGQVYIDLYKLDSMADQDKIAAIKTRIDDMMVSSNGKNWWWVDALYMAMPVFTRLGVLYDDDDYFEMMYRLYTNTKVTRGLFNTTDHLWYRDENFDPPYFTPAGLNSYWSRGNGWVFAAHARVLQLLPQDEPHRAEYIETFQNMAEALKNCQRSDGFWNASLIDPNDFGGPETSGTSFFTYGLAWGINNGFLDSATYFPVIVKAWKGLNEMAVHENGKLGYVQGVGSNPSSSQPVTYESTADYGVGAFLLAGTELVKMAQGEMPVPSPFHLSSVELLDDNNLKVTFNLACNKESALTLANYSINRGVVITGVRETESPNSFVLSLQNVVPGTYNVEIENITSVEGYEIEGRETKQFRSSGIINITASGYQPDTENYPENTLDGNLDTRWSSDGVGEWITYDLGIARLVKSVGLAFYNGDQRKAYFSISLSNDGTNFSEVYNGESSGTTSGVQTYNFTDQEARYVKIIGKGNSVNSWNSITEVTINYSVISSNLLLTGLNGLSVRTYPNPVNTNKLNIELGPNFIGNVNVQIINVSGRVVYSKDIEGVDDSVVTLNNLNLSKGVYLLKVKQGQTTGNCRFMVE